MANPVEKAAALKRVKALKEKKELCEGSSSSATSSSSSAITSLLVDRTVIIVTIKSCYIFFNDKRNYVNIILYCILFHSSYHSFIGHLDRGPTNP